MLDRSRIELEQANKTHCGCLLISLCTVLFPKHNELACRRKQHVCHRCNVHLHLAKQLGPTMLYPLCKAIRGLWNNKANILVRKVHHRSLHIIGLATFLHSDVIINKQSIRIQQHYNSMLKWSKLLLFTSLAVIERHLFTPVSRIIELGFSDTRVQKFGELVFRTGKSNFSDTHVLKTSKCSFIESDCNIKFPNTTCLYN